MSKLKKTSEQFREKFGEDLKILIQGYIMNKPSIIFVSTSEDYARFKSLCKDKGLSNARLFSHMLHKFPCGKHMLEFDELPIDSKRARFGLLLSDAEIKRLDSLCKIYGLKRPLMFKILLSWCIKDMSLEVKLNDSTTHS